MREILFRGKCLEPERYGEWIYGDLVHPLNGNTIFIITKGSESASWICDPNTVGQYTGLTDKSGRKIFEGDIVKCQDSIIGIEFTSVVKFGNPNSGYNWGWQLKYLFGCKPNMDILLWVDTEEEGVICEIIGNIYDNSDLLG